MLTLQKSALPKVLTSKCSPLRKVLTRKWHWPPLRPIWYHTTTHYTIPPKTTQHCTRKPFHRPVKNLTQHIRHNSTTSPPPPQANHYTIYITALPQTTYTLPYYNTDTPLHITTPHYTRHPFSRYYTIPHHNSHPHHRILHYTTPNLTTPTPPHHTRPRDTQ